MEEFGEIIRRCRLNEKLPLRKVAAILDIDPATLSKIEREILLIAWLYDLTSEGVEKTKQLRAGDIQSLVILPFDNYTGDDQLENMVASMHSLLIGDMGRLSGLRVMGRMYYAHLLMTLQRMDEALLQGKLALDLDPMNPLGLALYSVLLKGAGQHQSALKYIEKALSIDSAHSFTRAQLGRAYLRSAVRQCPIQGYPESYEFASSK